MFEKVLIANRGVIAVRILKALKKNNIMSVSVYTLGDEQSLHVTETTKKYVLEPTMRYLKLYQLHLISKWMQYILE